MEHGLMWYRTGPRRPPDHILEHYGVISPNGKITSERIRRYATYLWQRDDGIWLCEAIVRAGWETSKSCPMCSNSDTFNFVREAHHCTGIFIEKLVCSACEEWIILKRFFSQFEDIGTEPVTDDEVWDDIWIVE